MEGTSYQKITEPQRVTSMFIFLKKILNYIALTKCKLFFPFLSCFMFRFLNKTKLMSTSFRIGIQMYLLVCMWDENNLETMDLERNKQVNKQKSYTVNCTRARNRSLQLAPLLAAAYTMSGTQPVLAAQSWLFWWRQWCKCYEHEVYRICKPIEGAPKADPCG